MEFRTHANKAQFEKSKEIDEIPILLLKSLADIILPIIGFIAKKIMETGKLPGWKIFSNNSNI